MAGRDWVSWWGEGSGRRGEGWGQRAGHWVSGWQGEHTWGTFLVVFSALPLCLQLTLIHGVLCEFKNGLCMYLSTYSIHSFSFPALPNLGKVKLCWQGRRNRCNRVSTLIEILFLHGLTWLTVEQSEPVTFFGRGSCSLQRPLISQRAQNTLD